MSTSLILLIYIFIPIHQSLPNKVRIQVVTDLCAAPVNKETPQFKADTQYDIQYVPTDTINGYDDIKNSEDDWPWRHGAWGFKAASISMTQSNGQQYTENILIPAIPIFVPERETAAPVAIPHGQHFYIFAAKHTERGEDDAHKAIVVGFKGKSDWNLRVVTTPTLGSNDEDGRFCNTKTKEGMCFGEQTCCDAFENHPIMNTPTFFDTACRTIILCQRGVVKFDRHVGMIKVDSEPLSIYGYEIQSNVVPEMKSDLWKPLVKTEEKYICPDETYHIKLSCPLLSKKIDSGSEFHECPFCFYAKHKYQIFAPSDDRGKVSGDCKDKEKFPSFGFVRNEESYFSNYKPCCVKSRTKVAPHANSAYSTHKIEEEQELNMKGVSENKYEEKARQELRTAEREAAEREKAEFESGFIAFSVTRTLILGMLIAIFMIISSTFIYFR